MSYIDNFNLQIQGQKSAPKLVFLHGLMGSAANWRTITKSFVNEYHILTFDQRGHGRSFQPSAGYAPEDYAEDLAKILDELAWQKIHLVGHSLGGRTALQFAAQYAEKMTSLVIEDISVEIDKHGPQSIKNMLLAVPVPFANRSEAKNFFTNEFPQIIHDHPQPEMISQFFYANIKEQDGGLADFRFSKEGILASLEEGRRRARWAELKELQIPTLIVRGEQSQDLRVEDYKKMLACNRQISGVEVAKAGHWVHKDAPEEFIRVLKAFLSSVVV